MQDIIAISFIAIVAICFISAHNRDKQERRDDEIKREINKQFDVDRKDLDDIFNKNR